MRGLSYCLLLGCLATLALTQNKTAIPVHELISGRTLSGNWTRKAQAEANQAILGVYDQKYPQNNRKFVSFLTGQKGPVQARIVKPFPDSNRINVYIQLCAGEYLDERTVELAFSVQRGYNKSVNEWKTPRLSIVASLYENAQNIVDIDIGLNFHLKHSGKGEVLISLISESMKLDLTLSQKQVENEYTVTLGAISLAQIILLILYDRNQGQAHLSTLANTSQWLIAHTLCFTVVSLAMVVKLFFAYYDTSLYYLCLNALLTLIVIGLMLKTYEVVLEKYKNRQQLFLLVVFITVYSFLAWHLYQQPYFWVVESCLLFTQQIVHSIHEGGNGSVSLLTVMIILLGRIPLFLLLDQEHNHYRLRPDPSAATIIMVCLLLHSCVIVMQNKYGNRFFTPVMIMPDYFDYARKTYYNTPEASQECSICQLKIRARAGETEEQAKDYEERARQDPALQTREIEYVSTPCKHVFHRQCLSEWMEKSLTCPLDRATLPRMNA